MSEIQKQLESELDLYYGSPASIMQVSLDALEAASKGEIDIVDPTSPFMFLLEASATNTYAAILKGESVARELYPLLSANYSELYNHMADTDYLDRFAGPTKTTITIVIPIETFKTYAVLDTTTSVRRLTIPKDSGFTVGGYDWYVHRPIDINMISNGVIQVAYDLSYSTPLVDTSTNLLNYELINRNGVELLLIDIPVEQIGLESIITPVSSATGFAGTFSFADQFYYIRAYHKRAGGEWVEIKVTHSDQIYDASIPTLVAQVLESEVLLYLPDIYITNQSIGESIRTDIFTSKGAISADLSDYSSDDFKGRWTDLDNPDNPYITPLTQISDITIFADKPVIGGRDGLSLDELRNRVIYRSADSRASITFEELAFQLKDLNYNLSKAKDTITERRYICSRSLPLPDSELVSTSIGIQHGRILIDPDDSLHSKSVVNNGDRSTLHSDALFEDTDGDIKLLEDSGRDALIALPDSEKPGIFNRYNYLYSPFFYLLDPSDDLYSVRVYYLDNTESTSRSFIDGNSDLPFIIGTQSVTMERVGASYVITVLAEGPSGVSGVHAQLVYTDSVGAKYRLTSDQQIIDDTTFTITFILETSLDINGDDRIEITSMTGSGGFSGNNFIDLISQFDLYYFIETSSRIPSLMDAEVDTSNYVTTSVSTHEQLTLRFGEALPYLYTRAKANVTEPEYEYHAVDVPKVYDKDEHERDASGNLVWVIDPVTNKPVFNVINHAGDPVLDVNGAPIMEYVVGDIVLDVLGNAKIVTPSRLTWEIEPLLMDARYRIATAKDAIIYRETIAETILQYLNLDIKTITPTLMARTELAFQPTASIGNVPVIVNGKQTVVLDSSLVFIVNYTLTPHAFADDSLKTRLNASTRVIISEVLDNPTLSMGELTSRLMEDSGDNVISVNVTNPIGGYDVGVIDKENAKFSVKSEVTYLSNGTLDMVDLITVTYSLATS